MGIHTSLLQDLHTSARIPDKVPHPCQPSRPLWPYERTSKDLRETTKPRQEAGAAVSAKTIRGDWLQEEAWDGKCWYFPPKVEFKSSKINIHWDPNQCNQCSTRDGPSMKAITWFQFLGTQVCKVLPFGQHELGNRSNFLILKCKPIAVLGPSGGMKQC